MFILNERCTICTYLDKTAMVPFRGGYAHKECYDDLVDNHDHQDDGCQCNEI